jgi:Phage integrase family
VTRISLDDDITNRQLEHGAIYCGRFSLDFQPSLHDDRRIPKDDLFIWTPPGRERHLDGGVFLKLNDVCNQLTGLDRYVPLIIFLMVETGLRLEELCAVRWRDVALDKRRMEIAKPRWPKEHEARTIVLSVRVRWYLEQVVLALKEDGRFAPLAAVIPIGVPDVRRALEDVACRAQVVLGESLFDALHLEAEARFKEAGLTKTERDVMLGSALRILPGSQADLISIQDKLDWHLLDGRTYEEAKNSIPLIPADQIIHLRKFTVRRGYLKIEGASPTVIQHFPQVVLRILAA